MTCSVALRLQKNIKNWIIRLWSPSWHTGQSYRQTYFAITFTNDRLWRRQTIKTLWRSQQPDVSPETENKTTNHRAAEPASFWLFGPDVWVVLTRIDFSCYALSHQRVTNLISHTCMIRKRKERGVLGGQVAGEEAAHWACGLFCFFSLSVSVDRNWFRFGNVFLNSRQD